MSNENEGCVMGGKHTPGPWELVIDDTGGPQSGWPLVIVAADDDDKSVVRTGGQWPYEWDAAMSQREAVANARLIAASPDLLEAAIAAEASLTEIERDHPGWLADVDRRALTALRAAILKATGGAE